MANLKNLDLLGILSNCTAQFLGQKIAVGLSGGMDSVALAHAFFLLKKEVLAIHVHHGISKNANAWLDFSKDFAEKRGFEFVFEKVKLADFSENSARNARFAAFQKLAQNSPLFLAQHADDQMETILFKIARGGGLKALRGMQKIKKLGNLTLIRPWLSVPRSEILKFAKNENLQWVEDESNADTHYARNFLRHEVVAPLQKRFPSVAQHFTQTAEIAEESLELLNDLARLDFARAALSTNALSLAQIRALPFARLKNLLRFILEESGVAIPAQLQFSEFARQVMESSKSPSVFLGDFKMFVQNGKLLWQKSTVNAEKISKK